MNSEAFVNGGVIVMVSGKGGLKLELTDTRK